MSHTNESRLWQDRKHYFGLPISFTVYALSEDRLFLETGLLSREYEEVLLYRVRDISLKRSFWQMIFGVGTITLDTSDRSTPEFKIVNVKASKQVKELIHQLVEEAKVRRGFRFGEYDGAHDCGEDHFEGV